MKRLSYIAIALLAAACTSTEYLDVENLDPVLVINAQMTSSEDQHTIHLSTSSRSKVSPVPDGAVSIRINGGAPIAAVYTPPEEGYEEFSSSKYKFSDKLNPGDVIEVTGTKGALTATATVTVPQEPNLLGVEFNHDVKHANATDTVFGGDYYYDYWPYAEPNPYEGNMWHEIKIRFTDFPGVDNYYRVRVYLETAFTNEEGTETSTGYLGLDTSSEPVLTSANASEGGILDTISENTNSYCVFTDDLFKDKEYTLKLYFQEYEVMYSRKYHNFDDGHYDEETGLWVEPEMPEGWSYKANILVRLYSISQYQYIYLKALDLSDLGMLFSEPVSIPTNVEGGMGFINVDSCKEVRLDL